MPRIKINSADLLEEMETGDGGSPYMMISDEDWDRQEREMEADLDQICAEETFECSTCRDSGFGAHPGLYCSCRFGNELRTEDYAAFSYEGFSDEV